MQKYFLFAFLFLNFNQASAESNFDADKESIKKMAGCYEVKFQFAETFPRTKGYKIKEPYFSGALEWVEVDVDENDRVELQHLLIVGPGQVIKHWRQEWTYEPVERFAFKGDKVWSKENYPDKLIPDHWEQNVTQVDDSPRYECSAKWVHSSNGSYWECASWNPLPRREFSKRKDYNVLNRRNRHIVASNQWLHEQDNEKVIANNGVLSSILTEEKGKNVYRKIDDKKCEAAIVWWGRYKGVWSAIREAWDEIHASYQELHFKKLAQPLWQELWGVAESAYQAKWSTVKTKEKALKVIKKHLY